MPHQRSFHHVLLFRPVGLEEMRLIVEADLRAFPPRREEQPIFYPVLNRGYAQQIARDWNTKDAASGFAGYVTQFEVSDAYASHFERHVVGSGQHEEFWVPAAELATFNASLAGRVTVVDAFFGAQFHGYVPDRFLLAGKSAIEQFITLVALRRDYGMDFVLEIRANHTAVYLHYLFWRGHDFSDFDISPSQRDEVITRLEESWAQSSPAIPLPEIHERAA